MARDRQVEQNKNQSRTSATSGETSRSSESGLPHSVSERERNIETGRDQARERSSPISRPYGTYGTAIRSPLNSPFSVMRRMAEDMDRLFEHFGLGRGALRFPPLYTAGLNDDMWSAPALQESSWSPQVEIFQRGDKLVVRADLPGLKKEDVNIEVNDDILTISGERKDEREENRDGFYRSERSYGSFYRAIPLPDGVNADQSEATFNDGMLEVSFSAPKQQQRKAKKIPVR